jgi:hypothetical protein
VLEKLKPVRGFIVCAGPYALESLHNQIFGEIAFILRPANRPARRQQHNQRANSCECSSVHWLNTCLDR